MCGDLGLDGASCFHTLNSQARDIPKPQWDSERYGQLCISDDTYADWKAVMEKLCHQSPNCTEEVQNGMSAFFFRVEQFKAKVSRP